MIAKSAAPAFISMEPCCGMLWYAVRWAENNAETDIRVLPPQSTTLVHASMYGSGHNPRNMNLKPVSE
jgi:hypothetical protein